MVYSKLQKKNKLWIKTQNQIQIGRVRQVIRQEEIGEIILLGHQEEELNLREHQKNNLGEWRLSQDRDGLF